MMSKEKKEKGSGTKDSPIVLKVKRKNSSAAERLRSYKKPLQKSSSHQPLTRSSSKSADSLDSGIYSRQKSCDSMDSLDSNESGMNGDRPNSPNVQDAHICLTPSDEAIPPLPIQQYEDYLREVQDIRQSIIVKTGEEAKQPISRSNSGEDQDDDNEADWLVRAGLSDLVMTSSDSMMTSSDDASSSRISTDLSSMTVLSTLTRPQREAVLRRITSFNRAQKTKKRPKPSINSIFPTVDTSPQSTPEISRDPPERLQPPPKKPDELSLKSMSLPREGSYGEPTHQRRHSESQRVRDPASPTGSSDGSEHPQHKMDHRSKHRKNVDSIVASDLSGADLKSSSESLHTLTSIVSDTSWEAFYGGSMLSSSDDCQLLKDISKSLSMPELNNLSDQQLNFSASNMEGGERVPGTNLVTTENTLTVPGNCRVLQKMNSVAAETKAKLLNDVPVLPNQSRDSDTPRLLLTIEADGKIDKITQNQPKKLKSFKLKAVSSLKMLFGKENLMFEAKSATSISKQTSSTPRSQRVVMTHSSPGSVSSNPTISPVLKRRRQLTLSASSIKSSIEQSLSSSPSIDAKCNRSSSPAHLTATNSPVENRSPLHKLSSMSFSRFRFGSYRFAPVTPRRSVRRSRSFNAGSGSPVSLVSVKTLGGSIQFNSNATSIETLSINSKNGSPSWKGTSEETPMSFADDGKITKSMSYSETAKQDNLPNFSLVRDRLGITKICDLSPVDMRKVQSLALIELTALFDIRNIDIKRRKPAKMKNKELGVFGTPITVLVDWDRKRTNVGNLRVPLVLSEIISFLEESSLQDEGILRKSGSSARTKILRQDLESRFNCNAPPKAVSKVWNDAHSHDVAALLKQFLRELPDPLLSMEYIDAFQSCGLITDRKEQLQALNLLVILLNEVHRDSMKLLLKFLGQVIANEESNKMSLNNVAMITAPNLFISGRKSKKDNTTTQDLKHAAGTSNIVRMLIKYHKLLWTVPAFMLTQVRHMNRAEMSSKKHHNHPKEKSKYKFFQGGKSKDANKKLPSIQTLPQPFDYETPKGLIRIQAPTMSLTSMAVQLDDQLTVSDIIAKYHKQCGRKNHKGKDDRCNVTNLTHALYEVGGNIHERCLDPDTNMSALIKVNPEANWFLRPRNER